jgi:hypothetical protein
VNQKEAKELTLELWDYLANNPKVSSKKGVPEHLWKKIANLPFQCPLCDVFYWEESPSEEGCCTRCPISLAGQQCFNKESVYARWFVAGDNYAERQVAAKAILLIVDAWEPNGGRMFNENFVGLELWS